MNRRSEIRRHTAETRIELSLDPDGSGRSNVATGVGFFDHMLTHLAKHGMFDLDVKAEGDLHIDAHHTVEDVGICLGQALKQSLGDKAGVRRYGHSVLPMDEVLVTAAVDLGGRPAFHWYAEIPKVELGGFSSELAEEFWRAFAHAGHFNYHVILHHGRNVHHMAEAIFKASARALRMAVEADPRAAGSIPSTKGSL